VTVIDGMVVVQAMVKAPWVKTCAQWADHFIAMLDSKCSVYDEFLHLVCDRYDFRTSLRSPHGRDAKVASQPLLTK